MASCNMNMMRLSQLSEKFGLSGIETALDEAAKLVAYIIQNVRCWHTAEVSIALPNSLNNSYYLHLLGNLSLRHVRQTKRN